MRTDDSSPWNCAPNSNTMKRPRCWWTICGLFALQSRSKSSWATTICYGWKWRWWCKIWQNTAVEEQLHVCEPGGVETAKLNSLLHRCVQALWGILPRFFTTEPVPLKFSTLNTMDLWSGTDTQGGIWNCVWNACRAMTIGPWRPHPLCQVPVLPPL